jgi:nucleoside phosphorylase
VEKLGLVVAMEVEAMLIVEKLGLKEIDKVNKVYASNEKIGKYSSITLMISGIGMENSAISAQILVLIHGVDSILNFGYAGSNTVGIGTIVSPNAVFNNDFDLTCMGYERYEIPGTQDLNLNKVLNYVNYPCYSANHFVTESDEKNPVIYDMELHGIAMVCIKNNISIYSIKIITDCLDHNVYNESEADKKFAEILAETVIKYIEEKN